MPVTTLDTHTRAVVERIPIGHGAAGILMQPDGTRAYVACTSKNTVVFIDLKTMNVAGRIDAGPEPDDRAWAASR